MKNKIPRPFLFTVFLTCLIIIACKKEKTITFSGKLIFSSSDNRPVSNYEIQFYQPGSPGIPIAITSSSSSSSVFTDNAGNFKHVFSLGKGMFILIPTSNSSAIKIKGVGNNNFPGFTFTNAPPTLDVFPIFKKIDTAILKLNCNRAIVVSDTITVSYLSRSGFKKDTITGLNIPQGQQNVTFATIKGILFSSYDFFTKKYQNQITIYLKRNIPADSYFFSNNSLDSIGIGDENIREFLFYN